MITLLLKTEETSLSELLTFDDEEGAWALLFEYSISKIEYFQIKNNVGRVLAKYPSNKRILS